MSNVFVKSEFAPLKRVVIAQSEFAFPAKEDLSDEEFLTEETIGSRLDIRLIIFRIWATLILCGCLAVTKIAGFYLVELTGQVS